MKLVDAKEFAQAQADPLLGTKLEGRFEVIERIGTGGMGTVYRAKQDPLGRHVALKILKKELNWDKDTVTRFHREAKAMSLLTHPNTVRVFDFGETDDGLLFFAMELLEGELLTAKVERNGALDPVEAIQITQQILHSLGEAHSKGIIHRDLKPDNIYLATVDGHDIPVVKVLDFGIAKVLETGRKIDQLETQAGTVFGTPRYMSPEQAQGKTLDVRSDLYSVGVLLYHMLTGAAPFVDDDAVVVMAKHIREKPTPPRKAVPDRPIPGSLERVLMRTIEKDKGKRYKSAERLASRLESCIADVLVEKQIRSEGMHRSALRRVLADIPFVPALIGAALITGAVGVATYVIMGSEGAAAAPVAPIAAIGSGPAVATTDPATLVSLSSIPEGAEVWFDGAQLGQTPIEVRRPAGSAMDVELRLPGHLPAHAQLTAGGAPRVIRMTPLSTSPTEAPEAEPRPRMRRPRTARMTSRPEMTTRQEPSMAAPTMDPYERW
ncbi:MAG: serine/threonine protein kinase [Deltaproteobacteria bacterium]|nr:MAG: serine/threonine protein kinase [Deltaproteobacteria bacterium]